MKMIAAVPAALGILALCAAQAYASPEAAPVINRAVFHPDGSVQIPVNYHQWVHVGTRYKSSGKNFLDGSVLITPQLMNAYVEPTAMAIYQKTGTWPDGTQIVKEFSEIRTGADCDEGTRVCSSDLGKGIFETSYSGLALMVKDKQRYPSDAGNWAYFGFGHQPPPYKSSAQAFPTEQCAACHIQNAAQSGYVFTRAHIGLASGAP